MLRLSSFFLVAALVNALLGFGGIVNAIANVAQVLFSIFLIIFLITFLAGTVREALRT